MRSALLSVWHAEVQESMMMSSMKGTIRVIYCLAIQENVASEEEVCPLPALGGLFTVNPSSLKLPEFGHFILLGPGEVV